MAYLLSVTNGNLTSSTPWALVDATSLVDSRVGSSQITNSIVASTAFTPGAITIQGVALQMFGSIVGATGSMTVELYNTTSSLSVRTVTINVSDLPTTGSLTTPGIGWVYFKFSSSVTLLAATNYTIRLSTSVTAQVSCFSSATVNWSRALVTTTSQAPVATDSMIIAGTLTGAGLNTPVSVTMDNTTATTYANTYVGHLGNLTFATASSTNYNLTLAGNLMVSQLGSLIIGSSSSPIPVSSTATLQLTCTTALQYSMLIYGTMITYGTSKTVASKLAVDVIVGATSSTTTTTTNWLSGDLVVVPSTTRTYTQYELLTLNANASGTTLTHGAYVNAHGGDSTTKVQADIVNLTRNVIIRSTTGTLLTNKTNIQMFARSVTSFYYTAFLGLGTGITIANSGICVNALTSGVGSFDFQYNVVREIATLAALNTACTALQTDNTLTSNSISNNIFYSLGWTATVVSTVIASITDNNYFIACLATTQALNANWAGSNNVFSSNSTTGAFIASFYNNSSNNSFYSNGSSGLAMTFGQTTASNSNLSNFRFWRNNTYGFQFSASSGYTNNRSYIISFIGAYFFGNTTASIQVLTRLSLRVYFSNSFFYGGTTLVQPNHFVGILGTPIDTLYYDNCYFGYSDSSLTSSPFSAAILTIPVNSTYKLFSSCYFNSTEATLTAGYPNTNLYGSNRSFNHNGVTASNKEWSSNGTITTDTKTYLSSPKSTRLTPSSATFKLTTPVVRVPVKYNQTCTISTKIRKSVTADGTLYNGNSPRLMYAFNPNLGNFSETIGVTSSIVSTNQIFSPQNFENWQKPQATAVPGATAAPDGTLTGTAHIPNTAAGVQHAFSSPTTNYLNYTLGVTYTASVYAKKGTQNNISITMDFTAFGAWRTVIFDLNAGTIISNNTNSGIAPTITSVGNGWYRCTCTNTATSTAGGAQVAFDRQFFNYTGDNQISFYVWGAMQNVGNTAGTYIDNGIWETLTYTTGTFSSDGVAEFYVDCDGTTGWINVDDWDTTTVNDSRGQDYWGTSGVYIEPTFRNPTRGSAYIN